MYILDLEEIDHQLATATSGSPLPGSGTRQSTLPKRYWLHLRLKSLTLKLGGGGV
ncbi:predicted protein [Botrytis cinerea T4]|uniref:Uncharacterized protein n=1 Tax=Botryotinia fuckeliana (strain T4) TaxID=999810 RepID=G2YQR2_BOTF4|nr:predicted protein [Botrytis cinerea T4]